MTLTDPDHDESAPIAERLTMLGFSVFLRTLSLAFFGFSILIWLKAIGFWEGADGRFDVMSTPWKIYAAVLMVLFPVTSVGLWTTLSWGRVIWFIAVGFQIIAILRYPGYFGDQQLVLLFHVMTLSIYIIFQIALYFIAKKE